MPTPKTSPVVDSDVCFPSSISPILFLRRSALMFFVELRKV